METAAGDPIAPPPERPGVLPGGVWALGFVSLLMDISSEMIQSLLPVFLTSVLGVSVLSVGVIEGIAEATAAVTKIFSGALSDRMGKRKPLLLIGYGLSAVTKPIFAMAPTVGWIVAARCSDRLGKGLRDAPRDALVADLSPPHLLGAVYGLRQSLDTAGAFAGPIIAILVMALTGGDYRLVFWGATIPALLAVLLIVVGVREPSLHKASAEKGGLIWSEVKDFPPAYWAVLGIAVVMTLARFSEGFLLLRAQSVGLDSRLVPLVFVAMNVVYAGSSYPVGRLSDRIGRRGLLLGGLGVLILSDLILAGAGDIWQVMAGVALWGLHMGMTQGLLAAVVAAAAPAALRGTAFGLFNLVSGAALLLASVIAGGLWSAFGPAATFAAGAGLTGVALLTLLLWREKD